MQFLAVRDVPRPVVGTSGTTAQASSNRHVLWSVQVQHGVQRRRTRSVELLDDQQRGATPTQVLFTCRCVYMCVFVCVCFAFGCRVLVCLWCVVGVLWF